LAKGDAPFEAPEYQWSYEIYFIVSMIYEITLEGSTREGGVGTELVQETGSDRQREHRNTEAVQRGALFLSYFITYRAQLPSICL
jgi:hypothetical protein